MSRLVLFLVVVALVATGLSWLADRPGSLVVNWQGYEVETSVFRAVVLLAFLVGLLLVAWNVIRQIWRTPAAVGHFFNRRRQERGLEALSSGMIAIGAGDRLLAARSAQQARKALPNEPLTHLLRAQAAQLSGDRATSRRIFEAMLSAPDTEQLGLRGLYLEAEREGETEAARQFAERALGLNPKLAWPIDGLFEMQCKAEDWPAALNTLEIARRHGHIEKATADRRRAVLLTGQAQAAEEENATKAVELASEAHNLAPDLIPAAAIAGRVLAARGQTARVAKVIERTWRRAPHPDLAMAYAYARPGDSPRDRLERVKRLARLTPHSVEGPIAVATTAVEARDWEEARRALVPLLDGRLSQRVCTLMARIEGGEHSAAGKVREWLARAVNAPRDPVWTADGIISDSWAPISPVTGALDAFQWKVPVVASAADEDAARTLEKLEEFVLLGAGPSTGNADDLTYDTTAIEADEARPAAPQRETTSDHSSATPAAPPATPARMPQASMEQGPVTTQPVRSAATPTTASEDVATAEPTRREAAAAAITPALQSVSGPAKTAAEKADGRATSGLASTPHTAAGTNPAVIAPAVSRTTQAAASAASAAVGAGTIAVNGTAASYIKAKGAEPHIFVPLRAPDDPGLDDAANDDADKPVKTQKRS